jgi:Molybdopterin oxidoreductase
MKLLNKIIKTIYIFDHCNKQKNKNFFFTIVFDNLSIETFTLLFFLTQNYSFIKLKKTEFHKLNNDLESTFQLNNITNKLKLNSCTLCLLVAINSKYESYSLNLSFRQRILKGNFKCITIGSLIDLTFPLTFLGSNFNILRSLLEGNNFMCQDLKFSKKPLIIFNTE